MRIFVSYKTGGEDESLAGDISRGFRAEHHEVFMCRDLYAGEIWSRRIDEELEKADFFICLLSSSSISSGWVKEEIRRARKRFSKHQRPRILPVWLNIGQELEYDIAASLNDLQSTIWEGSESTPRLVKWLLAAVNRFGDHIGLRQFSDRDEMLLYLKTWLNGDLALLSLGGPPGRGKTRVARRLQWDLESGGNWRTLWVDCPTADAGLTAESTLDAIADKLRERLDGGGDHHDLGVDEYLPLTYRERLNLVTKWLGNERTVLVFDNFHHVEDVAAQKFVAALPGKVSGLKILLLTRDTPEAARSVYVPGVRRRLDPIPESWARDYLERHGYIVSDDEALRIHERSKGEPLLMNAFIIMACDRTVSEILELPASLWFDNGEGFIKQALKSLPAGVVEAGTAVSIFSSAERGLMEVVSGDKGAIDYLIHHYLLDGVPSGDRYLWSVHAVLREIWLSELGDRASVLHQRAAEWLEGRNTQEALERAFDHWRAAGNPDKALLCADKLWKLSNGHWSGAAEVLKLAQTIGNATYESVWSHHQGKLLEPEGDLEGAERFYRESLGLAEKVPAEIPCAESLHDLGGLVANVHRNFGEAEEFLLRSYEIYERHNRDERWCVLETLADHVYCAQGDLAWQASRNLDAESYYRAANELATRIPRSRSRDVLARSLRDLRRVQAGIHAQAGELETAESRYLEALAAADQAGDAAARQAIELELGSVRIRRSEAARLRGDAIGAEFAFLVLKSAQSIGARASSLEFAAYQELAKVFVMLDDTASAREHLFAALSSPGSNETGKIRLTDEVGTQLGAEGKLRLARSFASRASADRNARMDADTLYRDAAELFRSSGRADQEQQVRDEWAAFRAQFNLSQPSREQIVA